MDFAKKQLEKYGWSEGKGLGKQEDGIRDALKPKQKRGTGGIGHDIAEEFTNDWWNKAYNNASNNIEVVVNDDGLTTLSTNSIKTSKKSGKSVDIDKKKPLYFTNFVKTATLTNGTTESMIDNNIKSDNCTSSDDEVDTKSKKLTDQELFEACGGRTAHKGARHGLKSNGKLSRVAEQEKIFLENYHKLKSIKSDSDSCKNIKSKIKKKKKKSIKCTIET